MRRRHELQRPNRELRRHPGWVLREAHGAAGAAPDSGDQRERHPEPVLHERGVRDTRHGDADLVPLHGHRHLLELRAVPVLPVWAGQQAAVAGDAAVQGAGQAQGRREPPPARTQRLPRGVLQRSTDQGDHRSLLQGAQLYAGPAHGVRGERGATAAQGGAGGVHVGQEQAPHVRPRHCPPRQVLLRRRRRHRRGGRDARGPGPPRWLAGAVYSAGAQGGDDQGVHQVHGPGPDRLTQRLHPPALLRPLRGCRRLRGSWFRPWPPSLNNKPAAQCAAARLFGGTR
mmetsp:Transcript_17074/g.34905  ORF Transcript_17074/g.34905 Transcript_17074/m.34905 type:complete len:285 (-) Transcript_17074:109-963(-)